MLNGEFTTRRYGSTVCVTKVSETEEECRENDDYVAGSLEFAGTKALIHQSEADKMAVLLGGYRLSLTVASLRSIDYFLRAGNPVRAMQILQEALVLARPFIAVVDEFTSENDLYNPHCLGKVVR